MQDLLTFLGIVNVKRVYYQLSVPELVEHTLWRKEGYLAESGALVVKTGEFTGRSPKDKFIVRDQTTEDKIWWGTINQPFESTAFENLLQKVRGYLQGREIYVRDAFVGADPKYRLKIRIITEYPWQNLFAHHLFIRPTKEELKDFGTPDFTVLAVPGFRADSPLDKTRQHNFTIIDFSRKIVLIGGSAYTGEIKKSIFTVMNDLLPLQGVFPMHCSANVGADGDVAIFFGLSGTGKTTLSSDPQRALIGDDEHGWSDQGVFNFEGGCYAKVINLSKEKEPQIYNAIRFGTLLENVVFFEGSRKVNFADDSITPNTRAAYPIEYIEGAVIPSVGGIPKHIFMLTCDAYGIFPPIARLTPEQAMYHFISGYTAKIAGTEAGIVDPQATFSACFGEPFLPLHPTKYAQMLGEKMKKHNVKVWLVNTGWVEGPFGIGHRIDLDYTRAMIRAAMRGDLDNVAYQTEPIFGLQVPESVPNVPSHILMPKNTWKDPNAYDEKARVLVKKFIENFKKYEDFATEAIKNAGPRLVSV